MPHVGPGSASLVGAQMSISLGISNGEDSSPQPEQTINNTSWRSREKNVESLCMLIFLWIFLSGTVKNIYDDHFYRLLRNV